MSKLLRQLASTAQVAEVSMATYQGIEHVVVPVVCLLGDAVIRGMNSDGPELVPASIISQAPAGWNGRPIVPDHPYEGTQSANEPETRERFQFGEMFYTEFSDNRLRTSAYLNPQLAEHVGPEAKDVIDRAKKGQLIECSVGCYITLDRRSGVSNGKRYEYVWTSIVPDHLAIGLNGAQGACSVEMGCGGPRVNSQRKLAGVKYKLTTRLVNNSGQIVVRRRLER